MPFEYGTTLLNGLFITEASGKTITWSCEEIPELVDVPIDAPIIDLNNHAEISFHAHFRISKWMDRYLKYGWKARGPIRKRLLEKVQKRYLTFTTYLFERKEGEDYFEYKGSAF